ncbi:hypothetical protein ABTX35_25490 [Streptomyces sp. NPDC096080]|uniref:hypothetical protein n=1 Tax=Streptomyces sp. NPDC096080 TaxID=3156693 RepID=UPI0033218705
MKHTPEHLFTARHRALRKILGSVVRFGVLSDAADQIERLPQDWELDPGRGDAVLHLRQWAQSSTPVALNLDWAGSVDYPDGTALTERAVIRCASDAGIAVNVKILPEQRVRLASLLDMELRDVHDVCPTQGCGSDHDLDPVDLFGWTRLLVAGTDDVYRWYCTPTCVSNALARAGETLAAADQRAELDGDL